MRNDLEKLFSRFTTIEPPEGLLGKIMERIRQEKHLLAVKRRLVVIFLGFAASAAALIPVFNLARTDLAQSGFLQFFSLAFSDFGIIIAYWQSFAMSLLETIPAISLAMFFAVIFMFLGSLKLLARDVKIVYGYQ
jgi:ABC-type spermidine/putrescine transport system permease subunit I